MRSKRLDLGQSKIYLLLVISLLFVTYLSFLRFDKSLLSYKTELNEKSTEEYIVQKMSDCYKTGSNLECYQLSAKDFVNKFEIKDVMSVFDKYEKTPEFFEKCHATAHFMGREAYEKYQSIDKIFSEATHACLGGLYHGTIEGYFINQDKDVEKIDDEDIKNKVIKICREEKDYKDPQKFIECHHGLGHALMYIKDNDLPKALDLCDALPKKSGQSICYTGALMANSDSFGSLDHPTKYIKEEDLMYPCNILKNNQKEMCYTYGVLGRFQADLKKSTEICLAVPAKFQKECFETVGRDRTVITSDIEELKFQCDSIKNEKFVMSCIRGSSYNLVVRYDVKSDLPAQYCYNSEQKYKEDCYSQIVLAAKHLTLDNKVLKNFCKKIKEEEFREKCEESI